MTIPDALRIVYMCCYLVITAQLLFYIYVLGTAMRKISLNNFLEQRKIVDAIIVKRNRLMYYLCLLLNIIVIGISLGIPNPVFQTSIIAFVCLVTDIFIALKYNGPLNKLTSAWPENNNNADWEEVRTKWLHYINIRAAFIVTGMVLLIIGSVIE